MPVSFIQLSDIHFKKRSGSGYDLDNDLRDQILLDVRDNARSRLQNIKGILVCGDIAYSGKAEEYEHAKKFLADLCDVADIDHSKVYCVPGNHDVNHNICKGSPTLCSLQKDIEESADSSDRLVEVIEQYASDPLAPLGAHIQHYNEFAGLFGCGLSSNTPVWHDCIEIASGYGLHIHGLNSVLISSHLDHANPSEQRKMVLGLHQVPNMGQRDWIHMSLCHHPPQDWIDPNMKITTLLNARCHIQVYGHRHMPSSDNNGTSVHIASGAMQPSRWEGNWIPCYNWMSIDIDMGMECEKNVVVELYPRMRNEDNGMFIVNSEECKDGADSITYRVPLCLRGDRKPYERMSEDVDTDCISLVGGDTISGFVSKKKMLYGFLSLTYLTRNAILLSMELLDDEDEGQKHEVLIGKVLQKVIENDLVDIFCSEIDRRQSN